MISRYRNYGNKGTLDRIAKRRYSRELFDDIVTIPAGDNSQPPPKWTGNLTVEEHALITLLRCFNNFFNRAFDSERLFKALRYILQVDKKKIISSWLHHKKSDNIYVIGRFTIQIACFLELNVFVEQQQIDLIKQFFNILFAKSSNILDENYILIFGFLARKGFFRSMMGFITRRYEVDPKKLDNLIKHLDDKTTNETSFSDVVPWLRYLWFPLKFAVDWRVKVEQWIRRELEKKELFGSSGSLDQDYANSSIMNQSIISVNSEYSSNVEEPHSRQTRVFLKRLLSSWYNSIYFNDSFFQYNVNITVIELANRLMVHSVPIYLIILAVLQPSYGTVQRKQSIDSLNNYTICKTLIVQYKLNVTPSLGIIILFVKHICVAQKQMDWLNIGEEEAYGILVILHLAISGLADVWQHSSNNNNISNNNNVELNSEMTTLITDIKNATQKIVSDLIRLGLSNNLDPDVVLPLAYFYQNLRHELQLDKSTLYHCKLMLSKKLPLLRFMWSLISTITVNRSSSSTSSGNGIESRRISDLHERNSRSVLKMIIDGSILPLNEMLQFINLTATFIECLNNYLNTLYINESRRKISSNHACHPYDNIINTGELLWSTELLDMAKEFSQLTFALLKYLKGSTSSQNKGVTSSQPEQCQMVSLIERRIVDLLNLLRIFLLQIDKLNNDRVPVFQTEFDFKMADFNEINSTDTVKQLFEFPPSPSSNSKRNELQFEIITLHIMPQCICLQLKMQFIERLFTVIKANKRIMSTTKQKSGPCTISLKSESRKSLFKCAYIQLANIKDFDFYENTEFVLQYVRGSENKSTNEQSTSPDNTAFDKGELASDVYSYSELIGILLDDVVDTTTNQLFSCEARQMRYPNPYAACMHKQQDPVSSDEYYRYIGQLLALNLLNGRKMKKKFTLFFLEHLLIPEGEIYNINDLNSVDMEVAKNLMLLSKAEDGLECFNFNFTITQNSFGKLYRHEIIDGGTSIPVTNENKSEYIHRVVEFILDKQIRKQSSLIREGMDSIFPVQILTILSSRELQSILAD